MQYSDTIEYLYGLQWHGIKLGLDNPRTLLQRLGNPQDSYDTIHIAGTNGKGSTAAMLSAMLRHKGVSTGLFTSPHLLSFTERIVVDGVQITQDEVVELAGLLRSVSDGMSPTFFEIVTAMGFLHFRARGVDCAVVETGMGGRLDATNLVSPRVVVITPVGMDHKEFLGQSLGEIAGEKAGIIKPGVPVITAAQEPEVMAVIEARAADLGASLHVAGREFGAENIERDAHGVVFDYHCGVGTIKRLRIPLRGEYQALNASLAIRAFELTHKPLDSRVVLDALSTAAWPGRIQRVADDPPVYIDGAHNAAAAEALAAELLADDMAGRMTLVLGVMSDKDASGIIRPLLPLAREVIFTSAAYGRASKAGELVGVARTLGFEGNVRETASVAQAIASATTPATDAASGALAPVLVTGSFYTVGEALEAMGSTSVLGTLRESGPLSR